MRARFLALLAAVALASVLGYVGLDGTDAPDRAAGSHVERGHASRAIGGYSNLIATLPEVLPGVAISVAVLDDAHAAAAWIERRGQRRIGWPPGLQGPTIRPPASNKRHGRLGTPLERLRRQRWRIRYYPPPDPVTAIVRIRFARSRGGECFVPRAVTDVRTTDTSTP